MPDLLANDVLEGRAAGGRRLVAPAVNEHQAVSRRARILVLGAGFGGLELSAALSSALGQDADIILIDKADGFVFGFSKLDVMFGKRPAAEVFHPYKDITKPGLRFVRADISSIDPQAKRVDTDAGTFQGDVIVLALGADLDPGATPGLVEAGHEFYTNQGAFAVRDVLARFGGGRVVVGVTSTPFKCPPAPSETALVMHDYLTERGLRSRSTISLVMPLGAPIPPAPSASAALLAAFAERGIAWYPGRLIDRLDPGRKVVVFSDGTQLPYDLFLGVPRHTVPPVVQASGLTVDGWVPVDPLTLETGFPGVYALGDVTSVGTPKAGVFSEGQALVVASQIISRLRGTPGAVTYDGRGTCYLEFGRNLVGRITVTFPPGQAPYGDLEGPSELIAADKADFATSRIQRWLIAPGTTGDLRGGPCHLAAPNRRSDGHSMALTAIDSGLARALLPGVGPRRVERIGAGWRAERMPAPAAFVGRERELSRLTGALGGDARLMLVVGDAGVGKTRLVEEGMARAGAAGMVMVRGECLPVAGTLPLLPIAAALGELAGLDGGSLMEAALGTAPRFVRAEVGRLVPQLGPGSGPGADALGEGWQRGRLFAAVAQLLEAVAAGSGAGVGLVIEDVQWADSETLDFLTFLGLAGRRDAVGVVVTCRSDEAPTEAPVADWLAQVRGAAGMEELTLDPLSRAEVAWQVATLAGGPVPPRVVDELFARAEGNPFFTEQLVAAALADGAAEGVLRVPAGLPRRLAGLLAARAGRCVGEARAVLDALAVAGRPLGEDLLGEITGLKPEVIRRALRELAAARLLADDAPGGGYRPRSALLAEAVTSALLPGERVVLTERTAHVSQDSGALVRLAVVDSDTPLKLAAFRRTDPPAVLTPRELDMLKLVAEGFSNPDIARRLVLSEHTVHRHLANILRKLDLSSRAAAAAWGVRTGLV